MLNLSEIKEVGRINVECAYYHFSPASSIQTDTTNNQYVNDTPREDIVKSLKECFCELNVGVVHEANDMVYAVVDDK